MNKKLKIALIVIAAILVAIMLVISIVAIISSVASKALVTVANQVTEVEYDTARLLPEIDETTGKVKIDEDGNFNFIDTDNILQSRNFRVMQITDIHIGAGAFSMQNDSWTIRTVEDLIRREKPDLVVVTGDIAYPVAFQAGTVDNKDASVVFADLMERLGVFWAPVFGNHDTEAYSLHNRQEIADLYASEKYKHCIINNQVRTLSDGSKVDGVGNYVINLKNSSKELVHSLFMIDSNAYLPEDPFGVMWKYDKIHDNQVEWYKEMCAKLQLKEKDIKSTVYHHIPSLEMRQVVETWDKEGDSDHIIQCEGFMGEAMTSTRVASNFQDVMLDNNTTGVFVGHDHLNNASYLYDKDGIGQGKLGLKYVYGMSIDYLAYPGIYKKTAQRGGRMIEINSVDELKLSDNISDYEYKVDNFNQDKEFGYITYHLPYWKNLVKSK